MNEHEASTYDEGSVKKLHDKLFDALKLAIPSLQPDELLIEQHQVKISESPDESIVKHNFVRKHLGLQQASDFYTKIKITGHDALEIKTFLDIANSFVNITGILTVAPYIKGNNTITIHAPIEAVLQKLRADAFGSDRLGDDMNAIEKGEYVQKTIKTGQEIFAESFSSNSNPKTVRTFP